VAYAVIVLLLLARDSFGGFLCLDFSFVYIVQWLLLDNRVQPYVSTSASSSASIVSMAANSGLGGAYDEMAAHAGGVTGLWRATAALHFCDAPLLLLTGMSQAHTHIQRECQPHTQLSLPPIPIQKVLPLTLYR
jgi:hypothetical protein